MSAEHVSVAGQKLGGAEQSVERVWQKTMERREALALALSLVQGPNILNLKLGEI